MEKELAPKATEDGCRKQYDNKKTYANTYRVADFVRGPLVKGGWLARKLEPNHSPAKRV